MVKWAAGWLAMAALHEPLLCHVILQFPASRLSLQAKWDPVEEGKAPESTEAEPGVAGTDRH